jgi:copper(I)-binding protein
VRATAPGQKVAGAYLKITSATKAYLVGGSSPAAKTVELHEMRMDNNVMKMRPVARLELPAGKPVELKPGSYHLMLINVARPLVAGASVPIALNVEDQHGKQQIVEVKAQVGELVAGDHRHEAK